MTLLKDECIVALDERGIGWVIATSDFIKEHDILPELSTEDCGFNSGWDKDLALPGLYRVCVKPWSNQSYEGEWDGGVDVTEVEQLWTL